METVCTSTHDHAVLSDLNYTTVVGFVKYCPYDDVSEFAHWRHGQVSVTLLMSVCNRQVNFIHEI